MLRSTLSAALALLLTVLPLSAQTDGSDNTTSILSGRARGGWDLPARGDLGHVRGVLFHGGQRDFVMEARLTPLDIKPTVHMGRIDGVIMLVTRDGDTKVVAEIHGTYTTFPGRRGYFHAGITAPAARDSKVEPEVLGKMGGRFADPMERDKDPVGRFLAHWAIIR
jgi:hypothetical protein